MIHYFVAKGSYFWHYATFAALMDGGNNFVRQGLSQRNVSYDEIDFVSLATCEWTNERLSFTAFRLPANIGYVLFYTDEVEKLIGSRPS